MPEVIDNLYKIRHSLAHLLAAAVLELYPDAKPTLGPPIDNGFYYDFDFGTTKVTNDDLKNIQKKMLKTLSSWHEFAPETKTTAEAKEFFRDNPYKLELIDMIAEKGEELTFYTSGNFTDLCKGGHVDDMAKDVKKGMFQLDKVAGAYWRGDENNTMLTRIYGLAFETPEGLQDFLKKREEAKKRDHRKLGKELDLFTFSELVGPGLPLFTPKGTAVREAIVDKIMSIQDKYDYKRVTIPHITKPDLYKCSGHWEKFGEELFQVEGGQTSNRYVIKPMNCPHHTQIFASKPRSYRDMPLRYTETTMVYRDEKPGELIGLGRVISISQDDGHVFCRPDQIKEEIEIIVNVIREFYDALGIKDDGKSYWVSLSVRDMVNKSDKYLGDPKLWDEAEEILEEIAKDAGFNYKRVEGEAAFYGPKLDFQFFDALGRERQLSTIQLDFVMPGRFDLKYTDQHGEKTTPVMIHRAIAGSLERFLSVMIEHYAGAFPVWMAPVQVAILPISGEKHGDYAKTIHKDLRTAGVRVELHDAADSLGKRIRLAKTQKIPYLLVLGDKEVKDGTMTIEGRGDEKYEGAEMSKLLELLG